MSWFGGRKKRELTNAQEQLALRMAGRIRRSQRNLADYLNRRTAGWSKRGWLVLLVLLCLLMGTYCAFLVINALN